MPLSDEIRELAKNTISTFDASHDYYVHTKRLWRLLQQMVHKEGRRSQVTNRTTGSLVREKQLAGLAQGYVTDYLAIQTFQHFISLFEDFVFDFLRLWLTEFPKHLAGRTVEFRTVLDSPDKSAITDAVVQRELMGLRYERVGKWFDYIDGIVKLRGPAEDEIERIAEIKASRDILVHNKRVVNNVYISRSGNRARFSEGDSLELPEQYHRESWELLRKVVFDIASAAENRAAS